MAELNEIKSHNNQVDQILCETFILEINHRQQNYLHIFYKLTVSTRTCGKCAKLVSAYERLI